MNFNEVLEIVSAIKLSFRSSDEFGVYPKSWHENMKKVPTEVEDMIRLGENDTDIAVCLQNSVTPEELKELKELFGNYNF